MLASTGSNNANKNRFMLDNNFLVIKTQFELIKKEIQVRACIDDIVSQ